MDREDRKREKTEAGEAKEWGEHRNNNYCFYNNYDLNNNNNTDNNINSSNSRLSNSVKIGRDNHIPKPKRNLQVNPEEAPPPQLVRPTEGQGKRSLLYIIS